jgi:hypothetical protein
MGFNNYGLYFIWNNERMRVSFGDGNDYGAHWIMADPVDDLQLNPNGGELTVSDFTKVRLRNFPVFGAEGSDTTVWYEATVANNAGYAQWFRLQGGGNT